MVARIYGNYCRSSSKIYQISYSSVSYLGNEVKSGVVRFKPLQKNFSLPNGVQTNRAFSAPLTCWFRLAKNLFSPTVAAAAPPTPTPPLHRDSSKTSNSSVVLEFEFGFAARLFEFRLRRAADVDRLPRLLSVVAVATPAWNWKQSVSGSHLIGSRGSHSVARFCPQLQLKRRKSCYWGIELECVSVLETRVKVRYCQTARQLIKAKDAISHLLVEN